jgi:hypothetical protein
LHANVITTEEKVIYKEHRTKNNMSGYCYFEEKLVVSKT